MTPWKVTRPALLALALGLTAVVRAGDERVAGDATAGPLLLVPDTAALGLETPRPLDKPAQPIRRQRLPEWVERRAVMFGEAGDWEVGVGARSAFGLMVERQFH